MLGIERLRNIHSVWGRRKGVDWEFIYLYSDMGSRVPQFSFWQAIWHLLTSGVCHELYVRWCATDCLLFPRLPLPSQRLHVHCVLWSFNPVCGSVWRQSSGQCQIRALCMWLFLQDSSLKRSSFTWYFHFMLNNLLWVFKIWSPWLPSSLTNLWYIFPSLPHGVQHSDPDPFP